MGRPSKLSEAQWAELIRRHSLGESQADLCREFGVSKATVSKRISKPAEERKERIETVVNQLVAAESSFKQLDVTEQADARRIADDLLSISKHMARAANNGAAIAHRLSAIAATELEKVDDTEPLAHIGSLKTVSTLMNLAKDAAHIPLNLLAANKDRMKSLSEDPPEGPPKLGSMDPTDAARAYQAFMAK